MRERGDAERGSDEGEGNEREDQERGVCQLREGRGRQRLAITLAPVLLNYTPFPASTPHLVCSRPISSSTRSTSWSRSSRVVRAGRRSSAVKSSVSFTVFVDQDREAGAAWDQGSR